MLWFPIPQRVVQVKYQSQPDTITGAIAGKIVMEQRLCFVGESLDYLIDGADDIVKMSMNPYQLRTNIRLPMTQDLFKCKEIYRHNIVLLLLE